MEFFIRLKVADEVNGPNAGQGEEAAAESEETSSSSDEEQAERKSGKGESDRSGKKTLGRNIRGTA